MRSKILLLLALLVSLSLAQSVSAGTNVEALARRAVSENQAESAAAIAELRRMGPEGLRAMLNIFAEEIRRNGLDSASASTSPEWLRVTAALDSVAQQRDSYTSGLYWYTDMEEARKASKASGKPILSLRLLGKLSEELSCANSRFFRTVLYSNPEISRYLSEHFILHWKSVRPAPRVTIDYGDGRRVERTITGNSIHYILDSEGRIVDALPGLYGPAAFLRQLQQAEAVARQVEGQALPARMEILRRYHDTLLDATSKAWARDVERVGGKITEKVAAITATPENPPSARAAARAAITKSVVEINLVAAISSDTRALERLTDEDTWNKIAALYLADAKLDQASLALIRRQNPYLGAGRTDAPGADRMARLVQNFEKAIALDTMRNEYLIHSKIRAWLLSNRRMMDTEAFNERVYAELFLTPSSDPWLGLVQPDTYTGLTNDGISN
ncbi:MAG TPA: hypothetical protein VJS44_01345 [Pyrinomonadaceae bacterium]|nr:hypothetical protein [Pyrinomonadaceae bacterium]